MMIKKLEMADMNKVFIEDGIPHCKEHGAMNKVAVSEEEHIWRCIASYTTKRMHTNEVVYVGNPCRAGCIELVKVPVVSDFRTINMDEKWKEEHFFAQKKGDYARPQHCMNCKGNEFIDVPQGWRCKGCLALVWGSDFYQGRNSKAEELKEAITTEKAKGIIDKIRKEIDEYHKKYGHSTGYTGVCGCKDKEMKIQVLIDLFAKKSLSQEATPFTKALEKHECRHGYSTRSKCAICSEEDKNLEEEKV